MGQKEHSSGTAAKEPQGESYPPEQLNMPGEEIRLTVLTMPMKLRQTIGAIRQWNKENLRKIV